MKKAIVIVFVTVFALSSMASPIPEPSPALMPVQKSLHTKMLKGSVIDKDSKESLAGVMIVANGQKVYTDLDGNFNFSNLCNGKCLLKINLISYKDQVFEFDLIEESSLKIELQRQ